MDLDPNLGTDIHPKKMSTVAIFDPSSGRDLNITIGFGIRIRVCAVNRPLTPTYLADVDQLRVLPGRRAVCRKDGGSVAIGIVVDDVDGVLQGVGLHAAQDGAEYLLRVTLHVRLKTTDTQHGIHCTVVAIEWTEIMFTKWYKYQFHSLCL